MNINILSKCLLLNSCKRPLYNKALYIDFYPEYFLRAISSCSCPMVTLTTNLTSNFHKNAVSNSKFANFMTARRSCSTEGGPPAKKLPELMSFPEIVWPSIIKSLRNFILTTFIIRPYFDRDFNLPDFVAGSKQAVEVLFNLNINYLKILI